MRRSVKFVFVGEVESGESSFVFDWVLESFWEEIILKLSFGEGVRRGDWERKVKGVLSREIVFIMT